MNHPLSSTLLALALILSLPAAADCVADDALARFAGERYGERIAFDVLRNGKPVGEHVTTFEREGDALTVRSRMNIDITFLFLPVYGFSYEAEERWCGDTLATLNARVVDGDEKRAVSAARNGGAWVVDGPRGRVRHDGTLYPTNHWNPAVLEHNAVINTLTGRVNRVAIRPCTGAAAGRPDARCYDYTGDLEARVWYDARGRWVGLEFEGRDGSTITYAPRAVVPAS